MGLYFLCLYKLSSERVVHSKWICVVAVWIIIARSAGVKDFEMIRVICFVTVIVVSVTIFRFYSILTIIR